MGPHASAAGLLGRSAARAEVGANQAYSSEAKIRGFTEWFGPAFAERSFSSQGRRAKIRFLWGIKKRDGPPFTGEAWYRGAIQETWRCKGDRQGPASSGFGK